MRRLAPFLPAFALALTPTLASAHPGVGSAAGFAHGLLHPLSGIDHLLVMIAVGVYAARLGGRALWIVPASFVAVMMLGGAIGMAGIGLPFVEIAIALSVVALGGAIALGLDMPAATAAALVGVFALFHGHAHGAEMPETVSGLAYGAGFVAATVALHLAGIGLGVGFGRTRGIVAARARQLGGGAMALVGLVLMAGAL
jgi:urease accessory protein